MRAAETASSSAQDISDQLQRLRVEQHQRRDAKEQQGSSSGEGDLDLRGQQLQQLEQQLQQLEQQLQDEHLRLAVEREELRYDKQQRQQLELVKQTVQQRMGERQQLLQRLYNLGQGLRPDDGTVELEEQANTIEQAAALQREEEAGATLDEEQKERLQRLWASSFGSSSGGGGGSGSEREAGAAASGSGQLGGRGAISSIIELCASFGEAMPCS